MQPDVPYKLDSKNNKMKKNLIAGLLVLTLLLPSQIGAAKKTATKTLELSAASQKKTKAKSRKAKVKKQLRKDAHTMAIAFL